jgi:hypothetical protein
LHKSFAGGIVKNGGDRASVNLPITPTVNVFYVVCFFPARWLGGRGSFAPKLADLERKLWRSDLFKLFAFQYLTNGHHFVFIVHSFSPIVKSRCIFSRSGITLDFFAPK